MSSDRTDSFLKPHVHIWTGEIMGWYGTYQDLKRHVESEDFKRRNRASNPNDPQTALALAVRTLCNEVNPWGHKI
jgi:hypothetical protein